MNYENKHITGCPPSLPAWHAPRRRWTTLRPRTSKGLKTSARNRPREVVNSSASSGVDRVLAAAQGLFGRGRYRSEHVDDAGHRALIDAARKARVSRFVYVSASAASPNHPIDFFRTKFAIEQYLQRSGLPHVILRPTSFMEQHIHEFNGKTVLKNGRSQLIGSGNKKRNFVAAEDVARFAMRALLDEPAPLSPMNIGGPDNPSNLESPSS